MENVTYGRLAKIIAVYLKATVIMAGFHDTIFARVIHPPVDSILLQTLSSCLRDSTAAKDHLKTWKAVRWTQLDEHHYFELIESLRSVLPRETPLWKLEQYWNP